jgi:hypothetical protein
LLKVATPFCGVTVSVPARPVPLVRATVTGLVALVKALPLASSTATWTAGEIATPANAFEGCCTKASFAGGFAGLIVSTAVATALDVAWTTAIASTVDVTLIEIGPVYVLEEVVGAIPLVV